MRCSTESRERGEPLRATASVIERFLLIEDAGPWGPHVLQSARLPEAVRESLRRWKRTLGLRTLLIRRPATGRGGPLRDGPRHVFAVNARHGWAQATRVADLAELASADLSGMAGADGPGWEPHPDPIVLVCTHGRHDPCCAERGRPLAAALARSHPAITWEASHLGGDRFAGNLVVLPRGDYFGRLEPGTGPTAVTRYLRGELDLAHHRGRSTQPWPVQAAEAEVRRALGLGGLDDVRVLRTSREGARHGVDLDARGQRVTASVVVTLGEPAHLTCHADHDEPAPTYRVELRGA